MFETLTEPAVDFDPDCCIVAACIASQVLERSLGEETEAADSLGSADLAASIAVVDVDTSLAGSDRSEIAHGNPAFGLSESFQNCHFGAKDQHEVVGEDPGKLGLANSAAAAVAAAACALYVERQSDPNRALNC
jgi:hypothetical protein